MYINLFLNQQLVDVNDETEIKLKKEFQDPEELIVKEITYSYEIELPTTLRNKRVVGFVDAVDVRQKFNRVYDAQLYCNDMLVLNGKFIINEIDKDNYKGNLYVPAKKELKDILGDRTLRQLIPHNKYISDWDDITRINNFVGNIGGYGAILPPIDQRDNHICFPYMLYSWPNNKPSANKGKFQQSLNYSETTFDVKSIFPAFNVLSVLKDVFATDGYNLIGNVFDNPKFTQLFQSYSSPWDLYKSEKQTPYYLSFHCNGGLRKWSNEKQAMNTSSSAEEFDELRFRYCADVPLYSDNSDITNINDKYDMMRTAADTQYSANSKTIIVPVSGWYEIHTRGSITLPDEYRCDVGNPVTVAGWNCRDERVDFLESAWEFQIKKGVPKESPKYYCYNFGLPMIPVEYNDTEKENTVLYSDPTAVKIFTSESCRLIGKNGATTLVRDLSGFDTSDFICGARFGHQSLYNSPTCRCEHREYDKMAMMALYDVSKAPEITTAGDEHSGDYLLMHYGTDPGNTYGQWTCQTMVREDSFSNFEGYNLLRRDIDPNGNVTYSWDTTGNYKNKTYSGQQWNSVRCNSNTNGEWEIYTCVWLEEGDTIYPEIISPYIHQQDYCRSGCECSNRTNLWKRGCCNYLYDFDFDMGLVTTEQNWIPNVKQPVLTGAQLQQNRLTDVNKFLPEIKCNDYLNNFLQTFNCRLSQVDKNTFSIDYISTKEESGKILPIDDYCNAKDVKFKRITLPSTITMKWKIDTTEEGYVRGNDSPYNEESQLPLSQPNHTGEIILENPANTNGSVNKKESLWSYTWFKSIQLDNGTVIPAPIIANSAIFADNYDYEMAQLETLKTDYTMRLFYLYNRKENGGIIPKKNYIEITGDKTFRLLVVGNQLWTYPTINGTKQEAKLVMLDYDNSSENTRNAKDKTLTDVFFNLNINDYYQADIEMILPNHIFSQITANSKIFFNDCLWNVIEVDGHSVQEDSTCTISLKSL